MKLKAQTVTCAVEIASLSHSTFKNDYDESLSKHPAEQYLKLQTMGKEHSVVLPPTTHHGPPPIVPLILIFILICDGCSVIL